MIYVCRPYPSNEAKFARLRSHARLATQQAPTRRSKRIDFVFGSQRTTSPYAHLLCRRVLDSHKAIHPRISRDSADEVFVNWSSNGPLLIDRSRRPIMSVRRHECDVSKFRVDDARVFRRRRVHHIKMRAHPRQLTRGAASRRPPQVRRHTQRTPSCSNTSPPGTQERTAPHAAIADRGSELSATFANASKENWFRTQIIF